MKRVILMLLCAALVACGGGGDDSNDEGDQVDNRPPNCQHNPKLCA